jgi:menaquinone-dependent protoporphyrinogen oxidase
MGENNGRVLVVHGSRFGQSEKIARAIAEVLEADGQGCDIVPLDRKTDPTGHAALVLATSVRYGHFDKNAYRLIDRARDWLATHPDLLVTVSLTARKPDKREIETHVYTKKFLTKARWAPARTAIVAGALEYSRYNPFDRGAIILIEKMTGGNTDTSADIEYTDWDQVKEAAEDFATVLGAQAGA